MKPATTIEEQITLLKRRGMMICDEQKAREVLSDIGFYRLGFYAFPFEASYPCLEDRTHIYSTGTTFEDVVSLYYFDYSMRAILTASLNRIEINLRTQIAYICSLTYKTNPVWFADKQLIDHNYVVGFQDKVYNTIAQNPVIHRHHKKYTHDRFAPAWKTIEFMTIGNLLTLYRSIKDRELKRKVANHYGCTTGEFINYFETIRWIRNTCAHGACVYNLKLPRGIVSGPAGAMTNETIHNINGIVSVVDYMIGRVSTNRQGDMRVAIKCLLAENRSEKVRQIINSCTGW